MEQCGKRIGEGNNTIILWFQIYKVVLDEEGKTFQFFSELTRTLVKLYHISHKETEAPKEEFFIQWCKPRVSCKLDQLPSLSQQWSTSEGQEEDSPKQGQLL